MDVQFREVGDITICTVFGSIDSITSASLTTQILDVIDADANQIVLDFGQVEYVSSAGLRVLVDVSKAARQHGGDLRLAAVNDPIMKNLEMTGITSILKHYDDVATAVDSYAE